MDIVKGICTDISSEGKGVVKINKDIIFCDGLFIGEEALISILYSRAGVYYGKVKALLKSSPDRIQPRCKICTSCGGCQYQQVNYKTQLEYKTNRVRNALKHIASISYNVEPCIGMDNPYNYRNKIQIPFKKDKKGKIVFGCYKENSHEIIPIKECAIEDKRAAPILWDIKLLLEEMKIPVYDEDSRRGILRHVIVRTSYHYDELMVVLVTSQMNFPGQNNFIKALINKHPEITTIMENINSRKTNVILGDKEIVLYGKGFIMDSIRNFKFEISASSFYQINPVQVEKLYGIVYDAIDDNKNQIILDAYAGVGTIGMICASKAKCVYSVELNKNASKNAIFNAKLNQITNMKFACDDACQYISHFEGDLDVVIMDPPRAGSSETFLQVLIDKRVKQIIYVSCNPETLSRDLKYLSAFYKIDFVKTVDMFPMTNHVETIIGLCLKKK